MKKCILTFLALVAALALQARPMNRGLGNPRSVYIEKGSWQIGLSGSYNQIKAGGLDENGTFSVLGLIENLNGSGKLGGVSASCAWFFADNFSIGARFGYDLTAIDLDNATILSLLPFQNKHIGLMTLSGALACRGYIPCSTARSSPFSENSASPASAGIPRIFR